MIPLLAALLLVNALWNAIVWPRFYKRISSDPRARDSEGRATTFLRVHVVLIGVSLLIAAVSLVCAVIALLAG